jgi:hypothetical protein
LCDAIVFVGATLEVAGFALAGDDARDLDVRMFHLAPMLIALDLAPLVRDHALPVAWVLQSFRSGTTVSR